MSQGKEGRERESEKARESERARKDTVGRHLDREERGGEVAVDALAPLADGGQEGRGSLGGEDDERERERECVCVCSCMCARARARAKGGRR
jgi:hypothetical protein